MESICQGYKQITIYKIIWKNSEKSNDLSKYIFVGDRDPKIKKILNKLEGGYININASEENKLNEEIPYFKKQFGTIIEGKTHFIYYTIDSMDNVKHIMEDLCYIIGKTDEERKKILPNKQYLWYYPKYITYQYYQSIINYIFEKDGVIQETIKNKNLIKKITPLLMKTKDEMNEYIYKHFQKKYNDINDIGILDKNTYVYNTFMNNEEIKYLLSSTPVSLSVNYSLAGEENIFYSYFINPFYVNKDYDKLKLGLIDNSDIQINSILTNNGSINNNEIFMTTLSQLSDLPNQVVDYYFPKKVLKLKMNYLT